MTALTSALQLLALLVIVVTVIPAAWLVLQLFIAKPARRQVPGGVLVHAHEPMTLCVLIPAHNEERGLAATLAGVQRQLAAGDRVLVVADNCQDHTTAVALSCGAEVVERSNPTLRGKGYALQHGVDHLRQGTPPDIVVIVDADCELAPGTLDTLRSEVASSGRPTQALYLMTRPAAAATLPQRVAEFAWRVKNHARAHASHRLRLPCVLYGTGMAFPWAVIAKAPLASAHLVEDMQLGVDLAIAGHPPRFCESAVVTSQSPESGAAALRQRERWEQGHLQIIGRQVPGLVVQALRQRRLSLCLAAVDLAVPPLALLVMWTAVVALATVPLLGLGLQWPLLVMALVLACLAMALVLAWRRYGRDLLGGADLLRLPAYVLSKMTIYLRFARGYRAAWVRTSRAGEVDPP